MSEQTLSGFSRSTIYSFRSIEKKHDAHRGNDCMEKFCDHCYYTGEYRGSAHSICNLKYSVPKSIHIVLHNGSNYDYHFIMKESAEEFKKQFICFGENAEI